jgi:Ion channel
MSSELDLRPPVAVGHVRLTVRDVGAAVSWFETIGLRPIVTRDEVAVLELRGGTHLVVLAAERASLRAWQDRLRDPSLTVLLVLQVFLLFVALPLDATGVPIAEPVAWLLLLVALTLVVMLSHRGGAIVLILLGLAPAAASFAFGRQWSAITASVLNHGRFILAFSALTWVVAHALYAPGRITFHRLQGAAVVYLSLATIFAVTFNLVWELVPGAFSNLPPAAPGPSEFATMLYFSLETLTTTGYGDIVPLNPFARSLANLESVIGPFYLHHGSAPRDLGVRRPAPQPTVRK